MRCIPEIKGLITTPRLKPWCFFIYGLLPSPAIQSFSMALLEYNEIRERKIIVWEGQPYEVIHSHVFRKQQRKPVNATKLKNLITGRVAEISFGSSEKAEEADIMTRPAVYLYKAKGEVFLSDPKDKSKRFSIKEEIAGDKIKFIKANSEVELIIFTNDDDEEQDKDAEEEEEEAAEGRS